MNPAWVQPPTRALCVEQCRAACCRAPGSIALSAREANAMACRTPTPLVTYAIPATRLFRLNFSEHGGQCPMLAADATCRIYSHRPVCCHHFPTAPDPRCAVWPEAARV